MAFDIFGNWTSPFYPIEDRDNSIPILASKFDELIQTNLKQSFELCLLRNGANTPTANMNFGLKRITNLGAAVDSTDAVNLSQVQTTFATQATETRLGVVRLATATEALAGTNDTKAMTPKKVSLLLSSSTTYPPGFIKGFITENDGVNPDEEIIFNSGKCRNQDNTLNMNFDGTMKKSIILDWEAGDAKGGKPAGVTFGANDTVHCFVIGGGLQPATKGTFTTSDISANVVNFSGISDGYIVYNVNGGALTTLENLDFTLTASLADIALILQNRMSDLTVTAVGNTIVFESLNEGSASTVKFYTTTKTGTNIFDAAYLDITNGITVDGKDEEAGAIDFGFDDNIDATNLLADPDVITGGFTTYKRVGSYVTDATSDILPQKTTERAGGGIWVEYYDYIVDYSGGGVAATLLDLTVPLGIKVEAMMTARFASNDIVYPVYYVWDPDSNKKVFYNAGSRDIIAFRGSARGYVFTNTSGQVYHEATGGGFSWELDLNGYNDQRL